MARIYVASSWRNELQPGIVTTLREHGHEVYDFRNPPGRTGFAWSQIDPEWEAWSAEKYRRLLMTHPVAEAGFQADLAGMRWADTCLLVLPCGRSAHIEAGWMTGMGKRTIVLTRDGEEPDLMYKLCWSLCIDMDEALELLRT